MNPPMNLTLCFPRPSSSPSSSRPILVKSPIPDSSNLAKGHVVIKVDRFGWSANNVTYQALGEHPHFRYFDFHPAPTSTSTSVSPQTHGVVPVWGFGTVVTSNHAKISVGERLYGYFAPAKYVVLPIDEKDVNRYSIYVPRPHLPDDRRVYNQILRCSTDPMYTLETEDLSMLYRPLFWTSFWCEDWLSRSGGGYQGRCEYILISSASSKTAFCFAYCVRKRAQRERGSRSGSGAVNVQIIGLTSKRNMKFTKSLGLYHQVYDYDSFLSAEPFHHTRRETRWIYIDVAGNSHLNSRIYTHFASPYTLPRLIRAVSLGLMNLTPGEAKIQEIAWSTNTNTSVDAGETTKSQSTTFSSSSSLGFWPLAESFFTPEWLTVRRRELTPSQMLSLQKNAWDDLMRDCTPWVKLEYISGGERVKEVYEAMTLTGISSRSKSELGPEKGWIWSMWDQKDNDEEMRAKL